MGAFFQVLRRHLLAVLSRVYCLVEHELVAREILWLRIANLLELREHFLLGIGNSFHPERHIDGALQRVVSDRIDRLDNFRVVLEKVM